MSSRELVEKGQTLKHKKPVVEGLGREVTYYTIGHKVKEDDVKTQKI